MAYDSRDPRAALASTQPASVVTEIAVPESFDFSTTTPSETRVGLQTWIARAQNAVVASHHADAGTIVVDGAFQHEQMLVSPRVGGLLEITWNGESVVARDEAVVILPPGTGVVAAGSAGSVVQIIQHDEPGWAQRAVNADSYRHAHANVTSLELWPAPARSEVRVYELTGKPAGPFGRIVRSRAFMVNLFPTMSGPRDPSKLSPHDHPDFEQISVTVAGRYVHHVRTPWLNDKRAWRGDEHLEVGSPSMTVIPPPTLHTSEAIDPGENQMFDLFSPPRLDFSQNPGWVLNEDEYPTP